MRGARAGTGADGPPLGCAPVTGALVLGGLIDARAARQHEDRQDTQHVPAEQEEQGGVVTAGLLSPGLRHDWSAADADQCDQLQRLSEVPANQVGAR